MLYEVRVAANKGLGLFAKHSIPRGTRILAEKPLVVLHPGQRPSDILGCAKQLSKKSRDQLLELSCHPGNGIKRLGRWTEVLGWQLREGREATRYEPTSRAIPERLREALKDLREAFRILSIFRSNSFNLASSKPSPSVQAQTSGTDAPVPKQTSSPSYEIALFPAIARINHSCIPNAQANFHPLHQTFNVHATRDIPVGEEVSISYLPEVGQLRDQRIVKLEEGYGFICNCPACDLNTMIGQRGEHDRKQMQESLKKTRAYLADSIKISGSTEGGYDVDGMPDSFQEPGPGDEKQRMNTLEGFPEAERQAWLDRHELQVINSMLDMYGKAGIVGREVASIYFHLARLQSNSGAFDDALMNAEAGLRLEVDCLGKDHPEYLDAKSFADSVRKRSQLERLTTR